MRGTILGYDTTNHTGAIAGFDGQRYTFVRIDWRDAGLPVVGQEVDFVAQGETAAEIYPLPASAAAPQSASFASVPSFVPGPPFSWLGFLFSFRGRIDRKTYLLRWVLASWIIELIAWAIDYGLHPFVWDTETNQLVGHSTLYASWAAGVLLFWPHLATIVKRLHDRGRSGWFVLIVLIPIIGVIWMWIETWFLPGTPGPNPYGSGPMRT